MSDRPTPGPVALQPVEEDDLWVLEALTSSPDTSGEFAWFGWLDPRRHRRTWAETGLLGEDGGSLVVVREEERLGFVNWRRRRTTPFSYCWTTGIGLLPAARGHGVGTLAQRLLADYLFAHTPVHRLEADTEEDNVAEQRALEKAGYRQEGVLRGCAWRDGAWRNGVRYSLLRTDPR